MATERLNIDFGSGVRSGLQLEQAQKALRAMPGEAAASFARDHGAMAAQNLRELKRLTAKYGEAHPLVREKLAAVELDKALAPAFKREANRLEKITIQPDPRKIIVHGHVSDRKGLPREEIAVQLYDAAGKAIAGMATDEFGYFHFALDAAKIRIRMAGDKEGGSEGTFAIQAGPKGELREFSATAGDVVYFDLMADAQGTSTKPKPATGKASKGGAANRPDSSG